MELDLVFVFLLVLVLGTVFFVYFLLRKTLAGLQRGYDEGRRDR
ncbi:MAG: hypothetical protein A07HB70_01354 [uncultured archaeon A07HB70]|nr:MAG: hypothetical protein A07HB70_01354 [uncultured archaeon A07HB70]